jgi:hypothetical protein
MFLRGLLFLALSAIACIGQRYRRLGIEISDEPASTKQGLRFLFARETRMDWVGQLSEGQ